MHLSSELILSVITHTQDVPSSIPNSIRQIQSQLRLWQLSVFLDSLTLKDHTEADDCKPTKHRKPKRLKNRLQHGEQQKEQILQRQALSQVQQEEKLAAQREEIERLRDILPDENPNSIDGVGGSGLHILETYTTPTTSTSTNRDKKKRHRRKKKKCKKNRKRRRKDRRIKEKEE
ncbi:hypothetical protein SK128_026133 [Halocaridina rubra]|uniref:Uncharacterized protein n=1 Tax=Halocaridina rubra TaxID=373956 RepID=A0AAN8XJG3_HALRR